MALITIRRKGQITIPDEIRRQAHIQEGMVMEVELVDNGILMRPKILVDAEDAWFWTPEWQKGEAQASAELKADKGTKFASGDDFLAALENPPR